MNKIAKLKIDEIIAETDALFYQFILQTEDGEIFTWTTGGFRHFSEGFHDTTVFRKEEAEEAYWAALRDARDDNPLFSGNCRLDVALINIYSPK